MFCSKAQRPTLLTLYSFKNKYCRPKHWGGRTITSQQQQQQPRQQQHPFLQASRQKRKAELAAELTRGRRRATKKSKPSTNRITTNNAAALPVSFLPAFLAHSPTPSSSTAAMEISSATPAAADDGTTATRDTLVVVEQQNNIFLPNANAMMSPSPSPSPFSSPPPPSKKAYSASHNKGPLAKRLKSIRDNIKGDCLRLQSGQYPFSVRSLNPNDPRNRADTIGNVTILGNPIVVVVGGAEKKQQQQQQQHLIVLAMIHDWTNATTNATAATTAPLNIEGQYAWMSFTFETAREHKLAQGSQLRIYNAIPIPITDNNDDAQQQQQQQVKWMVVATQLCEAYPSHILPALPVVPST